MWIGCQVVGGTALLSHLAVFFAFESFPSDYSDSQVEVNRTISSCLKVLRLIPAIAYYCFIQKAIYYISEHRLFEAHKTTHH